MRNKWRHMPVSIGCTDASRPYFREELLRRSMAVAKAMKLARVVCNSYRLGGPESFPETNAVCGKCGRKVWCNPLFEGAAVKLCLRCADGYK